MHNIDDPRYAELQRMGEELNIVYNQLDGWDKIVSEPPERVPLPVNDFSVVIAPDGNGSFYRSLVEKSDLKRGEVSVWFLDYGGRATLPVTSLFKLHRYFTQLPYMSLNGYLAGCQLKDETRSDEFGRFLWDFVSRYCPLKATAVNMDNMGNYYILLHGHGGECINHILIDQDYVESVPYQVLQPLEENAATIPMIYYNKKTKMREKFLIPQFQPNYEAQVYAEYAGQREGNYFRKGFRLGHRGQHRKPWSGHTPRSRHRGPPPGPPENSAPTGDLQSRLAVEEEAKRAPAASPSRPAAVPKTEDAPDAAKCELSSPALRQKPPAAARRTAAAVVAASAPAPTPRTAPKAPKAPERRTDGVSVRTVTNSSAAKDSRTSPAPASDPDSWILVEKQKKRKNRRGKRA